MTINSLYVYDTQHKATHNLLQHTRFMPSKQDLKTGVEVNIKNLKISIFPGCRHGAAMQMGISDLKSDEKLTSFEIFFH